MPVLVSALVVFLGLGSGLSLAANAALPGDMLYPIKIHVNEAIGGAFSLSAPTRAEFETFLLKRRLSEAEQLASENRLDAGLRSDLAARIESQLQDARIAIQSASALNAEASTVSDLHADLETALKAHATVLRGLSARRQETRAQVQEILDRVSDAARPAEEERVAAEASAAAATKPTLRVAAEGSIEAATHVISAVRSQLEKRENHLDASARADVWARLRLAEKALMDARASLEAEANAEAFHQAKKAQRAALEARLLLQSFLHLQLPGSVRFEFGRSADSASSAVDGSSSSAAQGSSAAASVSGQQEIHVEQKANASAETRIEQQSEGSANAHVEIRGRGSVKVRENEKVKVDLGL